MALHQQPSCLGHLRTTQFGTGTSGQLGSWQAANRAAIRNKPAPFLAPFHRYNDPLINWAHFAPGGNISMAAPPTNGSPAVPSIVQALLGNTPLPPNSNFGCARESSLAELAWGLVLAVLHLAGPPGGRPSGRAAGKPHRQHSTMRRAPCTAPLMACPASCRCARSSPPSPCPHLQPRQGRSVLNFPLWRSHLSVSSLCPFHFPAATTPTS